MFWVPASRSFLNGTLAGSERACLGFPPLVLSWTVRWQVLLRVSSRDEWSCVLIVFFVCRLSFVFFWCGFVFCFVLFFFVFGFCRLAFFVCCVGHFVLSRASVGVVAWLSI